MRISVIIPVYQVSAYLERCLRSVMSQDVTDVECLLVDDGGLDDSIHLAKTLLGKYEGPMTFRLLTHPSNKGLSAARNTGVEAATGDYLLFLDGDDALAPGALTALYQTVTEHPGVDIVQGNALVEPERTAVDGKPSPVFKVDRHQYRLHHSVPAYTEHQTWLSKAILERVLVPVTSWNKLIRRSWLTENQLWFKEGLLHEDEHWTYLAAAHVGSLAFCNNVTYVHYIRPGSIMRSAADKSIDSWLEIIKDMVDHLNEPPTTTRRKVVLEVSFCNLVRIVKHGSVEKRTAYLMQQRSLLQPLMENPNPAQKRLERWLLGWFNQPLWLLKIGTIRHVKGLFLRPLNTYTT